MNETHCPYCKNDMPEVVYVRDNKHKHKCLHCGYSFLLSIEKGASRPMCLSVNIEYKGVVGVDDKVPSFSICDNCHQIKFRDLVRSGGIYWKCGDCGGKGAYSPMHPLAAEIREEAGVMPPREVGIDFTIENCPLCSRTTM